MGGLGMKVFLFLELITDHGHFKFFYKLKKKQIIKNLY